MNSSSGPHAVRIDELDGLRGLLALWVAVSHIVCMCGLHGIAVPGSMQNLWFEFVFAEPAVECFMILSGFAISFLLANRPQRYRAYIAGRFFRIYPVYITCLLGSLAILPLSHFVVSTAAWHNGDYLQWIAGHIANTEMNLGKHLGLHLPMLHGLATKDMLYDSTSAILGPAWSITLEWQYYLVAPLIARGARSTAGILLLTVIALLGIRFTAPWENGHLAFLPGKLPLFLIGITSYHVYAWFRSLQMECAHTRNLIVAGFVGAAVVLHWHRTAIVIWAVVFGCILAGGTDPMTKLLSYLRGFLLLPWLQRLGQASYALYLVHFPMIIVLLYVLIRIDPTISSPHALVVMLCGALPLILAFTAVLHRWVELPGMRLGRQVSRDLE